MSTLFFLLVLLLVVAFVVNSRGIQLCRNQSYKGLLFFIFVIFLFVHSSVIVTSVSDLALYEDMFDNVEYVGLYDMVYVFGMELLYGFFNKFVYILGGDFHDLLPVGGIKKIIY